MPYFVRPEQGTLFTSLFSSFKTRADQDVRSRIESFEQREGATFSIRCSSFADPGPDYTELLVTYRDCWGCNDSSDCWACNQPAERTDVLARQEGY